MFIDNQQLSHPSTIQSNSTMERREGASDLDTDMPQWAVVTVALIICLALALAIIVIVGGIGGCVCGPRNGTPSHARSRDQFQHRASITDNGGSPHPATVSVDTITLASVGPPPPVYVYPPRYPHDAPFMAASNMERGQGEGAIHAAL